MVEASMNINTPINIEEEKESLTSQLDELESLMDSDEGEAEEKLGDFSSLDKQHRENNGNDDGNEDHPETYRGDGYGEQIVRLNIFINQKDGYLKQVKDLKSEVEKADTDEKIYDAQEKFDALNSNYDDDRDVLTDV